MKFKKHDLSKPKGKCNGYLVMSIPDHPFSYANGCVYLHRLVMENHLGRFLDPSEHVHHKDENRTNNSVDNLEILSASEHAKLHLTKVTTIKCICGKSFQQNDSRQKYCSIACSNSTRSKIDWPSDEELQKLVWKIPTQKLAAQLGVSDVAIAKRCKARNIEKPARGYWSKPEHLRLI